MSALALDIGTYSIKAISGDPGKKVAVKHIAEVFNTTGIAVPTDEATADKLGKVIQTILEDYNLPRGDVRVALPETVVSTKVIAIPPLTDAELASAIGWQAEQHIPIPPEELSLEYEVLYRPTKNEKAPMRVLLVGARRRIVEHYVNMFNDLGIEPKALETHVLAIYRSLEFSEQDPTTLLAHIGASTMNLAIIHKGELQFVLSHLNGGQLLTKALEQTIGLDATQAEQYKRTYGLDDTQFQGKVASALTPAVKVLTNEIKKAIQFFLNSHPQDAVQRVVLSGGSAMLPGLVQFVTQEVGTEVLVAAPFASATGDIPDKVNHPAMAVAMGLLARDD